MFLAAQRGETVVHILIEMYRDGPESPKTSRNSTRYGTGIIRSLEPGTRQRRRLIGQGV